MRGRFGACERFVVVNDGVVLQRVVGEEVSVLLRYVGRYVGR
jgi:hypothetical protein